MPDHLPKEQEKEILKKFDYMMLFMKHYIYDSKMHNQVFTFLSLSIKFYFKYRIETFSH